jgi:DNA-binding SARP family transcriptional activator
MEHLQTAHKPCTEHRSHLLRCQPARQIAHVDSVVRGGAFTKHMDESSNERDLAPSIPLFRIWSCGPFQVEALVDAAAHTYEPVQAAQWGGSTYPRLLLKALLCCPGRRARRETLIEMLWPESEPEQATQYLNTGATRLRRLLRPAKGCASLLFTEENASSYGLTSQEVLWVDAEAIFTLLRQAERMGRTTALSLPLLEEAAGYAERGTFLEGETGAWVQKQRRRVEEMRYRCRLWLSEAYEQQGMPGQAETLLGALLSDDPADEDVLYRLLLLLHKQRMLHKGRQIYHETERLLQASGRQLSQAMMAFTERLFNASLTDEETPFP